MIEDIIINQLVNLVVSDKFKIDMLHVVPPLNFRREKEYIDKNKEFKNIFTDFVVNEFLKTSEQSNKFIKLIFNTFTKAINLYILQKQLPQNSITFLYKGGNILRLIALDTFHELPGAISDKINQYYKDSFKKSDADFTIYINPDIENFDDIYKDINNLSYILQNEIRLEFQKNLTIYFEFYKLNLDVQKEKLIQVLEKLNNTETLKTGMHGYTGTFTGIIFNNVKIDQSNKLITKSFIGKRDYEIEYDKYDNSLSNLFYLTPIHKSNSAILSNIKIRQSGIFKNKPVVDMFISSNQTLRFKKNNGNTSFSLVRTKMSFDTYFKYNNNNIKLIPLDGELIDVTVNNKDDSSIKHFFDNYEKYISTYTIGTIDKLEFKAYSIEYLLEDLENILFRDSEYPWDDNKYAKRIKRILFMYMLMLLMNESLNNNDRISYVTNIKKSLEYLLSNYDINKMLQNIKLFLSWSKDNNKIYPFRFLMKNLGKLLLNQTNDNDYVDLKKEIGISGKKINNDIQLTLDKIYEHLDWCSKNKIKNNYSNILNKIRNILTTDINNNMLTENNKSTLDLGKLKEYINIIINNINIMIETFTQLDNYKKSPAPISEGRLLSPEEQIGGYYKKYKKYKLKYLKLDQRH